LAASPRPPLYSLFFRHVKRKFCFFFACSRVQDVPWKPTADHPGDPPGRRYTDRVAPGSPALPEVGILIVDDDIANQRALKNILDAEGWRVRIVHRETHALAELATGSWNLAIVNTALTDIRGPLFCILKELSQTDTPAQPDGESPHRAFRALFLVPATVARQVQPTLEREGLPYSLKPYHLNDFLEKVSELLVEAGAIAEPIRSIGGFARKRRRRDLRFARDGRRGTMFASREDYQMTEEEMAEFERQEEEERKKRAKAIKDREHL
jgi:CheY-like chemotaxis protein